MYICIVKYSEHNCGLIRCTVVNFESYMPLFVQTRVSRYAWSLSPDRKPLLLRKTHNTKSRFRVSVKRQNSN